MEWPQRDVRRKHGEEVSFYPRTRRCSPSSQALQNNALCVLSAEQGSAESSLSSIFFVNPLFREVCYNRSRLTTKCPLLLPNSFAQLSTIRFRNMQKSFSKQGQVRRSKHRAFRGNGFCNRAHIVYSSPDRNSNVSQIEKNPHLFNYPATLEQEGPWPTT